MIIYIVKFTNKSGKTWLNLVKANRWREVETWSREMAGVADLDLAPEITKSKVINLKVK